MGPSDHHMGQNIGVTKFPGEKQHIGDVLTLFVYVFNFFQIFVNVPVKYTSKVVVFDRFIDDSH